MHSWSEPDLYWATTNIGEALPGVLTPLSWSLWNVVSEGAPREAAFQLGVLGRDERHVPQDPSRRYTRVFFGRAALQLKFLTQIGDRMPGTSGEQVAMQVCGRVPEDLVYEPTRRRYPVIAFKLPYAFATVPSRARAAAAQTDAWYRDTLPRVPALDLAGAIALVGQARRRFHDMVALQTLALFSVVQPLYDGLEKLIAATGVGDLGSLSGSGGAEMQVVQDIWRASRNEITLEQVVSAHGFHGPLEGELSSHVWREDPAPLRAMIEEYRQLDDSLDPARQSQRVAEQHATACRQVLAAVHPSARPAVRLLLSLAAKRIPLRGVVKRSFLQSLDACRAAVRRAGECLAADGRLAAGDDVFYLTIDELTAGVHEQARELIARRRDRRTDYQRLLALPETWKGQPVAVLPESGAGVGAVRQLSGIGVSAGVAEGTARVLLTPDFDEVEPGDVLVAPTTDPGWSSVMFLSAALVVDIGGALSHAAVVAREMGIPCVVNTREGTRSIRTGDRLRVDGSAGTVEILVTGRPGANR